MNTILLTDSYKVDHWRQYPPGTTGLHAYLEARGAPDGSKPEVVFFGLQYILETLAAPLSWDDLEEASELFTAHFNNPDIFNRRGWEHIMRHHNRGLPVAIRAVPEGTPVPAGNVLMTVEATDPAAAWLVSYIETLLLQVWYPSTIATSSRAIRATVKRALDDTGDPSLIDFKVHDFGFRGSTSIESAGLGAAAHLLSFCGTDTLRGIELAKHFYRAPMAGFSIPAAEHSTITSWGRDGELEAYRNMLDAHPTGLVAAVSDSYDVFTACEKLWGGELRERVLSRDGCLVIRPDSGDPAETVVRILHILGERFGFTRNDKGYKVLDPHVRVIQGDGIDHRMIVRVLSHMGDAHWSADNVAFGSGGGLLQNVNRDTFGFAYKTSARQADGQWHDVYKDPITAPGKRSKRGRLSLYRTPAGYVSAPVDAAPADGEDALIDVFRDGEILVRHKFSDIRARAQAGL